MSLHVLICQFRLFRRNIGTRCIEIVLGSWVESIKSDTVRFLIITAILIALNTMIVYLVLLLGPCWFKLLDSIVCVTFLIELLNGVSSVCHIIDLSDTPYRRRTALTWFYSRQARNWVLISCFHCSSVAEGWLFCGYWWIMLLAYHFDFLLFLLRFFTCA